MDCLFFHSFAIPFSSLVLMNSLLSVLGRSVLRPMAGAVFSSIAVVISSCATISSHWVLHTPKTLHCLLREGIESIIREMVVDLREDIRHMVLSLSHYKCI